MKQVVACLGILFIGLSAWAEPNLTEVGDQFLRQVDHAVFCLSKLDLPPGAPPRNYDFTFQVENGEINARMEGLAPARYNFYSSLGSNGSPTVLFTSEHQTIVVAAGQTTHVEVVYKLLDDYPVQMRFQYPVGPELTSGRIVLPDGSELMVGVVSQEDLGNGYYDVVIQAGLPIHFQGGRLEMTTVMGTEWVGQISGVDMVNQIPSRVPASVNVDTDGSVCIDTVTFEHQQTGISTNTDRHYSCLQAAVDDPEVTDILLDEGFFTGFELAYNAEDTRQLTITGAGYGKTWVHSISIIGHPDREIAIQDMTICGDMENPGIRVASYARLKVQRCFFRALKDCMEIIFSYVNLENCHFDASVQNSATINNGILEHNIYMISSQVTIDKCVLVGPVTRVLGFYLAADHGLSDGHFLQVLDTVFVRFQNSSAYNYEQLMEVPVSLLTLENSSEVQVRGDLKEFLMEFYPGIGVY